MPQNYMIAGLYYFDCTFLVTVTQEEGAVTVREKNVLSEVKFCGQ